MFFRTEAAIDLDAAEHNFNVTRAKLPKDVKLLCVIKADAYGHGAVPLARLFDGKADFFGVACIEEAIELKKADIKTPILILGAVAPELYKDIVKYDIRIPIFSYDDAKALSKEAVRQGKTVPFHFCVDTGMSRIGFQVNKESADICKEIIRLPMITAEGLFSHFATADEKDLTKAVAQRDKFREFIELLEERGIDIPVKHINNSAGIMNFDDYFDMCRMGIILYGLYPSHEVDKSLLEIRPVMEWRTHISHIKELEAGREISYGGTYTTDKTRRIATIPVGYADGYPRCLSNRGSVLINGQSAPIVGRVCMDQFMVDITQICADIGDTVILVGKSGSNELSMEEVSESAYSFNYELPCRISRRVPRTYYRNGKLVFSTNYLY
ncbi:MAG TPA: alanine racemase [Candidatus Eubacterium faecavium]|nr:alanine racemase [Candidatus Eubacterium faecavium]